MAAVIDRLKWLFHRLEAFGRLITRLINLLLVGLTYFLAVGPLALVMRLFRRDLLEPSGPRLPDSFWRPREQAPAELERFRRQF